MKRLDYLDNVAGILISFMMLIHVLAWNVIPLKNDSLWLEPLQFFMYWFYFKSGMFFKQRTTRNFLNWGGKKLLYPFLVFSLLGYILYLVTIFINGDRNWIHYLLTPIKEFFIAGSFGANDILWFLTSLFCVQFLYNELMLRKVNSILIVFIGFTIAYLCHFLNIHSPEYLGNIALGISMYSLGHICREKQFHVYVASLACLFYMCILILHPSHLNLRYDALSADGIYILALMFSVAGCIVINNIFRYLPNIPVVHYIGRHSMDFYVVHMLALKTLWLFPFKRFGIEGITLFIIMCVTCLIVPPVFRKITPKWLWAINTNRGV